MFAPIDLWKSAGVNFGGIGNSWTPRWPFGTSRRQAITITGTTSLAFAAGTGLTLVVANYIDIDGGSGNRIVKLPAPSSKFTGSWFEIRNAGTGGLNIQDSAGVAVIDMGRGSTFRFWLSDTAIIGVQELDSGDAGAEGDIPTATKVIARLSSSAGDIDITLARKYRVIDAWMVNSGAGGAADTIQIKNGANAITDAMDANQADQAVTRATTLDQTQWDISAGGTLRITNVSGPTVDVYVTLLPVA